VETRHILKAYHVRQIGFKLQNVSMYKWINKILFFAPQNLSATRLTTLRHAITEDVLLFNQISQQHFMAQNSIE
jgi:hypothetical protein